MNNIQTEQFCCFYKKQIILFAALEYIYKLLPHPHFLRLCMGHHLIIIYGLEGHLSWGLEQFANEYVNCKCDCTNLWDPTWIAMA